jgi:hypothetical protein
MEGKGAQYGSNRSWNTNTVGGGNGPEYEHIKFQCFKRPQLILNDRKQHVQAAKRCRASTERDAHPLSSAHPRVMSAGVSLPRFPVDLTDRISGRVES